MYNVINKSVSKIISQSSLQSLFIVIFNPFYLRPVHLGAEQSPPYLMEVLVGESI